MFNSTARPRKKTTAQAMVEFALALPVLLLVIYGLIEAGRLLFIYATVVTSARQAVRYGSATGANTSNIPFYKDCPGIIAAANNVAFINSFSSILVTYDGGLDASGNPIALSGTPSCTSSPPNSIQNGYRIKVSVSTQYSPIVPLVPFQAFTITSTSTRTLLASVAIGVTAPPQQYVPSAGLSLTVVAATSSSYNPYYASVGDIITYTYILTNNGTTDVSGPYTVADTKAAGFNCGGAASPLAPGASTQCTGTYAVTQADLDNETVSSISSMSTSTDTSAPFTMVVNAVTFPSLSLTKTANPSVATVLGQTVTYTYTILNTGNVTLTSPFSITDDHIASSKISCSGSSIAPGGTTTCTGTYKITNTDITAGAVTNTANATAAFKTSNYDSPETSAIVATKALFLSVTASPMVVSGVGQTINYTYTLKNTATSQLTSPAVSDNKAAVNCSAAANPLPAGQTTTCSGTYVTTQADVDAGVVSTIVTASAVYSGAPVSSNQVNASVTITQTNSLTLSVTTNPTQASAATVIAYYYKLTNSGNTTLSAPFVVTDDRVATVTCAGTPTSLAPGASTVVNFCTGSYTAVQADVDAGSIIDHATATAKSPLGLTVTSSQASATVITWPFPRLTLVKSANPASATFSGQTITYTYTLKNTGNSVLTPPYAVTDNKIATVTCSSVNPIPIGGSTTCSGTYDATDADFTAGSITNTATASAWSGVTQLTDTKSLTITAALPIACDPRHSSLKTSPFSMTVFNYSLSSSITISQIQIYFNVNPATQRIKSLSFGGVLIWGPPSTPLASPAVFNTPFTGSVIIPPGGNKILIPTFVKTYKPANPPVERILISFVENGCPAYLDSSDPSQLP
jgi:large repetitive protein